MTVSKHIKYLSEKKCPADPFILFNEWFTQAKNFPVKLAEAVNLATVDKNGRPSSRIVLLKYIQHNSFIFFTNLESRKSKEISGNPYGTLTFFWRELDRQVRIEGVMDPVSSKLSDKYFISRPLGSRISAWVSPQSREIPSRRQLEQAHTEFRKNKASENFPRPPFWGGFALKPDRIEFWQGRDDRLHDRIVYVKHDENTWSVKRLAP